MSYKNCCKIRCKKSGNYVHLNTDTSLYELKPDEERACTFSEEIADLFLNKISHTFGDAILIKEFLT